MCVRDTSKGITAGSIMDMKVQSSRKGKALSIGELLTSACCASALLDHMKPAQGLRSGNVQISCCQLSLKT